MPVQIVLPAVTERVTVRKIPELFAWALHPDIPEDTPRQVIDLKKNPLTDANKRQWCGEGTQAFPVRLSAEDMAELKRTCWNHLPDLLLPIDEAAWQPYAAGFDSLNITDWQLETITHNPALHQRILWHAAVDEYTKEIRGAVMRGELTPRAPLTHLPIPQAAGEQLLDAFVAVENLSEYAARHGIIVSVAPDSLTSEQVNAKEQAGRYTLEEAGKHLDGETNNGGEALLMQAAMTGVLKVYAHGNTAAFPCAEIKEHRNYLEAYWDELNDWLGSNHPRIAYKYPAPSGASEKNEPPAPVGIPSAVIIEKFRLAKGWIEKLRKPDRNKYLLSALAQRGQVGRESHRWNPAKFGDMLIDRKERNQRAVSEVIHNHFTGYSDELDSILALKQKGVF